MNKVDKFKRLWNKPGKKSEHFKWRTRTRISDAVITMLRDNHSITIWRAVYEVQKKIYKEKKLKKKTIKEIKAIFAKRK